MQAAIQLYFEINFGFETMQNQNGGADLTT